MAESLNVIALISGGKDSFYSILHCIQNGHKVVALGNLYPPASPNESRPGASAQNKGNEEEDEQDLNSFMYQTVGHTVIPLYEQALGIPLYRQKIIGDAIQTGTTYSPSTVLATGTLASETESRDKIEDETESLIPLLKRIMTEHPDANALSTGAILSTYQRTRVESVALRLGLTPLSYLWQYPTLPPGIQTSLLRDMQAVGLDARIIKVASGGLDESFLWENVASEGGIRRVERSMKRFSVEGDGGVLGEGGEFETLVVDGPRGLFKGRMEIREENRRVVREGGGSAWLRILDAKVVMKTPEAATNVCRIPEFLEQRFIDVLSSLKNGSNTTEASNSISQPPLSSSFSKLELADTESLNLSSLAANRDNTLYRTVTGNRTDTSHTIASEAAEAIFKVRQLLERLALPPSSIVSATVILRSMQDFASVNSIYGKLFTAPNPPSRVTISCGDLLPKDTNLIIHLKLSTSPLPVTLRKALHVQSRSYWAPANIGPYSQATSVPILSSNEAEPNISAVSIAGQIPLIASSMTLPSPLPSRLTNHSPKFSPNDSQLENFKFQTVLALQHLFRIGTAMAVSWFTGTVAYFPSSEQTPALSISTRAILAGQAWTAIHARPPTDDNLSDDFPNDSSDFQHRDLWEEKHYAGLGSMGSSAETKMLPDWERVDVKGGQDGYMGIPSFWAAEVEELPRGAGIEWAVLSGVVGAAIKVSRIEKKDCWTVEQCCFGDAIQTVVMVPCLESPEEISRGVEEALESVSMEAGTVANPCWLDLSIRDIGRALEVKRLGGVVPCRSLWDISGKRLAAVLVFNTIAIG